MKIYYFKINHLISNQKQNIIDLILQKYPCQNPKNERHMVSFLKRIFDFFVSTNQDLFIGYQDKEIVGLAFVITNQKCLKEIESMQKVDAFFDKSQTDGFIQHYLCRFKQELRNFSQLEQSIDFNHQCIISICQFFDNNNVGTNWFMRSLFNYYWLQNKKELCFYKINQSFIEKLKPFCHKENIEYEANETGIKVILTKPVIDEFDYLNFIRKNILSCLSWRFSRLNWKGMWTKTYYSPLHPENNIIMIHGVNSNGETFVNLVPALLNYGNVIILDLPSHDKSKDANFLKTEWNMINYALFLMNWIDDKGFDNIYLYGHSMGGGIAAILNVFLYNRVKGLVIEDGYNGYCSLVNQKIGWMTKSLWKNYQWKNEFKKTKNSFQYWKDSITDFYRIYKPFTKKTWMFFLNLFNIDILLQVDQAYLLNLKPSLAIYGVNDGVVNAQMAEKFFKLLNDNWEFHYISNAHHSSHDNNLAEVKQNVCNYFSKVTKIKYQQDYDLDKIDTSINIGNNDFDK